MAKAQRRKGKDGELEFAELLRDHGFDARRGQQHKGTADSPDVVSDLPIHWEVKRRNKWQLAKWLKQCREEADGKLAAVAVRADRGRWGVFMDAEEFLELVSGEKREEYLDCYKRYIEDPEVTEYARMMAEEEGE